MLNSIHANIFYYCTENYSRTLLYSCTVCKLDEPETTVLYKTTKVGVNKTGEMLKNLTKLVGMDSWTLLYTNHSVRATLPSLITDSENCQPAGHNLQKNSDPVGITDPQGQNSKIQ